MYSRLLLAIPTVTILAMSVFVSSAQADQKRPDINASIICVPTWQRLDVKYPRRATRSLAL